MISLLFSASLAFSATATGVEKGTPVEFLFAGRASDRDYETMFILNEPIDEFCARLEKAGLPRGTVASSATCDLWPTGCKVTISPSPADYVETVLPNGILSADWIYTGGSRNEKGTPLASEDSTRPFGSYYTLSAAPLVWNGIYNQGDVYGAHKARVQLEKGTRVSFTLSWDENAAPRRLDATFKPETASAEFLRLKDASKEGEVVVRARFDPAMTVSEAQRLANAISLIDSPRVKFNGHHPGELFYRAFLPSISWLDRQQRLTQPFELTLGAPNKLVHIEEDWTVEGNDPKLTAKEIPFEAAANYPKTNTCFIYATGATRLEEVFKAMKALQKASIVNWYVFVR